MNITLLLVGKEMQFAKQYNNTQEFNKMIFVHECVFLDLR